MSLFQAAILGLVQGLTEFLPVSSSAHLVIFTKLFNLPTDLFFDAMLHVATLLAVLVYFGKDIINLLLGFLKGLVKVISHKSQVISHKSQVSSIFKIDENFRISILIIVASIPTALMGILFEDYFEAAFSSILAVAGFLFLTGIVILLAEYISRKSKVTSHKSQVTIVDALLIGIAQGCAIAPGLSRSGTTIAAALSRGLDRKLAARFSFLLSIPVILGAGLFQLKDVLETSSIAGLFSLEVIFGMLIAFVSGYFAIKIFMQIIEKSSLRLFAYYVFALSFMILIFYFGF